MPQATLAGLPRLVRIAGEVRWRGWCALGMALAVAGFWTASWLLHEGVRPLRTGLAAASIGLPTALVSVLAARRRVREALLRTQAPPRSTIHETLADGRERRTRLSGIVLTGVIVLLLFDHATGGAGTMAGLVVGLFGALGASEVREAALWDAAEDAREARLYAIVRPHALTTPMAASDIYETPRSDRRAMPELSRYDLGI